MSEKELKSAVVLSLSVADLESMGYDVSEITQEDLNIIASDIVTDSMMESFWVALEFEAEERGLKKTKEVCE